MADQNEIGSKNGIYEATLTLKGKTGKTRQIKSEYSLYTEATSLYPDGTIALELVDVPITDSPYPVTDFNILVNVAASEVKTDMAHVGLYVVPEEGEIQPSRDEVRSWKGFRTATPNETTWYKGMWATGEGTQSSNPVFPEVGGNAPADFKVTEVGGTEAGAEGSKLQDGRYYVAQLSQKAVDEKGGNQTMTTTKAMFRAYPDGELKISSSSSPERLGEWDVPADGSPVYISNVDAFSVYVEGVIAAHRALVNKDATTKLTITCDDETSAPDYVDATVKPGEYLETPDTLHGADKPFTHYVKGPDPSFYSEYKSEHKYRAELTLTGRTIDGVPGKVRTYVVEKTVKSESKSIYPDGTIELNYVDAGEADTGDNSIYPTLKIVANVNGSEAKTELAHVALYAIKDGKVDKEHPVQAWKAPRGEEGDAATWYLNQWPTGGTDRGAVLSSPQPMFPAANSAGTATLNISNIGNAGVQGAPELEDGVEYIAQLSMQSSEADGANQTMKSAKVVFGAYPEGEVRFEFAKSSHQEGEWTVPAETRTDHITNVDDVQLVVAGAIYDHRALVTENAETNLVVKYKKDATQQEGTPVLTRTADPSTVEHLKVPEQLDHGTYNKPFSYYVIGESPTNAQ